MSVRRMYETTYIINAALEDNDVETAISRVQDYITNNGGDIVETNKWGRRRLNYPINKKFNGFYVHCVFNADSNMIPAMERFFILDDNYMRHLTVQLTTTLFEFRKTRAIAQAERAVMLAAEAAKDGGSSKNEHSSRRSEPVVVS